MSKVVQLQVAPGVYLRVIQAPTVWTTTMWLVWQSPLAPFANYMLGQLLQQRAQQPQQIQAWLNQTGFCPEWLASQRETITTLTWYWVSQATRPSELAAALQQIQPMLTELFEQRLFNQADSAELRMQQARRMVEQQYLQQRTNPQLASLTRCLEALQPDAVSVASQGLEHAAEAEVAWRTISEQAPLIVYLVVADAAQAIGEMVAAWLQPWIGQRQPLRYYDPAPVTTRERLLIHEYQPHIPSQMSIAWSGGATLAAPNYAMFQASLGLLGAFPRSRWLQVLRQQHQLTYAIKVHANRLNGMVAMQSLLVDQAQPLAQQLIEQTLAELQTGRFGLDEQAYAQAMLDREQCLLWENPRRLLDHCVMLDLLGQPIIPRQDLTFSPDPQALGQALQQLQPAALVNIRGAQ